MLGVYLATFLYSLLVLRTIRDDSGEEPFVPHAAVSVAVLLAVLSVGVLVYFIHHISDSVQVWTLVHRVRDDLLAVVDLAYPEPGGGDPPTWETVRLPPGPGVPVRASRDGYVASVDSAALLDLAVDKDAVLALRVRSGSYCVKGSVLATAWRRSKDDEPGDAIAHGVRKHVTLKDTRTPRQDIEFGVQQVIELAVRALSPSTNDPYTALNAFDQLSAGLARLVSRPQPSPDRFGSNGTFRLRAPVASPALLIDMAYEAVRAYALEHPMMLRQVVDFAARVGDHSEDPALRRELASQPDLMLAAYERTDPQEHDLERLRGELMPIRNNLATARPAAGQDP